MARYRRYALRLRRFLNPLPSEHNSYVSVTCESSRDGQYEHGMYLLNIADSRRVLALHFDLSSPASRKESLWKIDELLDTLATFRTALYKEANAIKKKQG